MKKVMIVAAHPDDEVLGCGGTMAKLAGRGAGICTLILGEGITSRDKSRNLKKRKKEVMELKRQAEKANKILGVKQVFTFDFPDNRFDTIPLLDIVKIIEDVKKKIKPEVIYTHYWEDLNIDHRITYQAVLTACRPVGNNTVKEIYSFEIPSSTEWNYPDSFSPDVFVDIEETFDRKVESLCCYTTEVRKPPHPRSEESLTVIAKRWGAKIGLHYAEAFKLVRLVR